MDRPVPNYVPAHIVSAFSLDVYSYDEDDMVLDPSLAEHLSHFGIDMLKMQKVRTPPLVSVRLSFLPLWLFCA